MKRIAIALVLALMLIMLLGTPALAGPPDDEPGNMPGKSTDLGDWKGLNNVIRRVGGGLGNGNGTPPAYGIYAATVHAIPNIMDGDPPGKPHWASAP